MDDLDFKKLDASTFRYMTYLGMDSMASDVKDWHDLPKNSNIKLSYGQYCYRYAIATQQPDPRLGGRLGFKEFFEELVVLSRNLLLFELLDNKYTIINEETGEADINILTISSSIIDDINKSRERLCI